jgi:TP901 family phage tail tape measure protein
MAQKVEILIQAKDQFRRVFDQVQRKVADFQQGAKLNQLDKALASNSKNLKRMETNALAAGGAIRSLRNLILPLIGIQLFAKTIGTIAQFEERMSGVQAVTGAVGADFDALTATARELGAVTRFSASEAAAGMEFLGRAGFDTLQIIDAMPGVLALAAAGQLSLAEAADIASNVLQGFGESADQADRAADILAATAASTNTNVSQLGQAMSFVAPVAAQLGITMEDTAAAIGALSNAGVQSTRAGTGLRKVLSTLASLGAKTKEELRGMGVAVENLNPATNDLQTIIRTLGEANLDTAKSFEIFGDRGAVAATILAEVGTQSEDVQGSLASLIVVTNNAAGAAQRMADIMSDNVPGAFRNLRSAFEEAILQVGDNGLGGALRDLIDNLTVFLRAVNGAELSLNDMLSTAGQVGRAFRIFAATLRDLFSVLTAGFGESNRELSLFAAFLNGASVLVAAITDGFTVMKIAVARLAQIINTALVTPIGLIVKGIARIVKLANEDWAKSLDDVGTAMTQLADGPREYADELTNQLARGDTALQRTFDRIAGVNEQMDDLVAKSREAFKAGAADAKILYDTLVKQEQELARQVEAGAITAEQAQEQFGMALESNKDQIVDTLAELERLAQAADSEAAVKRVEQLRSAFLELDRTARQVRVFNEAALKRLTATLSLDEIVKKDTAAAFSAVKTSIESDLRDLERQFEDNALSANEYFSKRVQLQQQLIDKEIARLEVERAAAEDLKTNAGLAAKILELQAQRKDVAIEAARDQKKAEEDLAKALTDVRKELSDTLGQPIPVEDLGADLRLKFKDLYDQLEAEGNEAGIRLVDALINEQLAQAKLNQFAESVKATLDRITRETTGPNQTLLEASGSLLEGTKIAQQALVEANAQRIAQINELEKQGLIDAQDAQQARLKSEAEYNEARLANTREFFGNLASLSQSGNDKIAAIGKAAAIVQATIDGVVAVQKALAAAPPPVNYALAASVAVQTAANVARIAGFAEGGFVSGPGTSTSDSIPARLSDGEYVMRAKAVQHYGAGFMEMINRMSLPSAGAINVTVPKVPHFADGGLVTDSGAGDAGGGGVSFRIVNVTDPSQIDNYMGSAAGERAILNVIRRNSTGVKQVLRS